MVSSVPSATEISDELPADRPGFRAGVHRITRGSGHSHDHTARLDWRRCKRELQNDMKNDSDGFDLGSFCDKGVCDEGRVEVTSNCSGFVGVHLWPIMLLPELRSCGQVTDERSLISATLATDSSLIFLGDTLRDKHSGLCASRMSRLCRDTVQTGTPGCESVLSSLWCRSSWACSFCQVFGLYRVVFAASIPFAMKAVCSST